MAEPVTLDMSTAQPIQANPVKLDMSTAQPLGASGGKPGWLDRKTPLDSYAHATESGVQSIGRGLRDAVKGTWNTIVAAPKDDTEKKIATTSGLGGLALYRTLRGLGHTAEDATQLAGAIHDINQSDDPLGAYAKAAQETAGQGAGQAVLALATEGAAKAAPPVVGAVKGAAAAAKPAIRAGVGAMKDLASAENISTAVGAGAGAHLGHLVGEPIGVGMAGAAVGRVVGKAIGKSFTPKPVYPGAPLPEALPTNPGAPLPATPLPEQINPALVSEARTLPGQIGAERIYGPKPEPAAPIPTRPGLALQGEVAAPVAEAPPVPAPAAKISPAEIEKQLNDAMGGKALQRGVPLRNQGKTTPAKLPEGFTPVQSTALKGYKYDPIKQEFESITSYGQRYVHGDVSPEQAAAFEAAESKGRAWNELRQSSPLVAKIVNGKRITAQPPVALRTSSPEIAPPAGTQVPQTSETQLDLLQQMLRKAMSR